GYTVHVDRNDKYGVITMYHPLGPSTERSEEELVRMAEEGMKYLQEVYNPILEKNGEQTLNIRFAEANLWKKSIMIAAPGHYRNARVLRQPIGGRIHLGHSSIGTPSNEEAQYRGWRVGTEISAALSRSSNLRRAR